MTPWKKEVVGKEEDPCVKRRRKNKVVVSSQEPRGTWRPAPHGKSLSLDNSKASGTAWNPFSEEVQRLSSVLGLY